MKSATHTFAFVLTAGLLLATSPTASAVRYEWGGREFFYNSTGADLDYNRTTLVATSNFVWEVGTFKNGFTPDGTNLGQYAENWQPFDGSWNSSVTTSGYSPGWAPSNRTLAGTGGLEMNANGTSSNAILAGAYNFQGSRGYIWVKNGVSSGSEWGLVTNPAWIFDANAEAYTPSTRWRLYASNTSAFSSATDVIVGAMQNPFINDIGAGTITTPGYVDMIRGDYNNMQTAIVSFTTVPEPSGVLLLGSLGWMFGFVRRRR
jgi:hypothetical protein